MIQSKHNILLAWSTYKRYSSSSNIFDSKPRYTEALVSRHDKYTLPTPIDKSDFYLYLDDLKIFKSLCNNNRIITILDKVAGEVILNKQDYINKIAVILDDTTNFKTFVNVKEWDKTAVQEQRILCELFGFYSKLLIPKKIYERLYYFGSQRPWLYGLPKYHKQNIPLRHILSMVGSAQHRQSGRQTSLNLLNNSILKALLTRSPFKNQIQNYTYRLQQLILLLIRHCEFIF